MAAGVQCYQMLIKGVAACDRLIPEIGGGGGNDDLEDESHGGTSYFWVATMRALSAPIASERPFFLLLFGCLNVICG